MTRSQAWVLALTATAALMVALDQLVVATALPSIRDDLHASLETLDWTVNAYSLSFAVLLVTGAAMGDRYGRRRMFATGLTIFSLSSIACALAPDTGLLIAARAVQGAGSALVMPLAVALLTAAFPVERRGPIVGLFTALVGLAVVGGPVVGGAVTEGIAWQWIFWINIPIGAVLIPLVLRRLSETRGEPGGRFDLVGVGLVTGAVLGVVWGLVRSGDAGWSSAEVLGTLIGGAVLGLAFVTWELRTPAPMMPMSLFRSRSYAAGNAATLLLMTSLYGTVFVMAQYLQISLGYSPLQAGLRFLPWTTTLFVVAPLAGLLTARVGVRALLVGGLLLQALGFGWLAHTVAEGAGYLSAVIPLLVAGCGTSMAMPSMQNAVMNSVAPRHLGQASGTFGAVRQVGGVLGVAILSAVFAAEGSYADPASFRDGVAPAVAVAAALAFAGALAGLLVGQRAESAQRDRAVPVPATVSVDVAA